MPKSFFCIFLIVAVLLSIVNNGPILAQDLPLASVRHDLLRNAQNKREETEHTSGVAEPGPFVPFDSYHMEDSAVHADSGVSFSRVAVSVGGLAAAITALHIYQLNAWWANQRTSFHVIEDPNYQADFDKFGHNFGAYYSCHFFDEAFKWTGMDSAQSTTFAALAGALWEFYVEIEDGFAQSWGFSRGDAKSDILGASFFLIRNRIPFMRNFNYKWFYLPTSKLLDNKPDIPGQTVNFIEDYGGQSYYITMDVHGMLPDGMKPYWPSWLNLALGIGGYNINSVDLNNTANVFDMRKKAFYISLDYDMEKVIPESNIGIINFIRRGLNYWHFPAPAYRIYPDPRFYILFPFQMSIG